MSQRTEDRDLAPLWVVSAGGGRAAAEILEPWRPLQSILESLSMLFAVEIVIIDRKSRCVAGTGPYSEAVGLTVPPDTALAHSLRSEGCVLVHNPRENDACNECSLRQDCHDQANYSGPVSVAGQVVAAAQIVAFDTSQRSALLERAEATFALVRQLIELMCRVRALPGEVSAGLALDTGFHGIMGDAPVMRRLRHEIARAAGSQITVLVSGESGTGKELVARAIHAESGRQGAFVPVNCGALPEALVESELFGYASGAFSGASPGGKAGLWELADKGTLFLDEVGELTPALQVTLLRTLEDGMVRRVGGKDLRRFDVRVIAATNRSLAQRVEAGAFRQDLFYRLKGIPVRVPALRERPEDIPMLASYFLERCCRRHQGRTVVVDAGLMGHLVRYPWPGNVRELQNCIEFGFSFCEGTSLTWDLLARYFDAPAVRGGQDAARGRKRRVDPVLAMRTVEECGSGVEGKREAARRLGVSLATLYRALSSAQELEAEAEGQHAKF